MRKALFAFALLAAASGSAQAATSGLNPSALRLKIYKVAISKSALCTNPVTIFETSSPSYTDFLGSPTLGSGNVSTGNYPCVIIEFSDDIKPTPAATTDNNVCVSGSEFDLDVCGNGNTSTLIDGTTTTCSGSTEDRVAMYLSTYSTATNGTGGHSPWSPPTYDGDALNGFNLASSLTVTGTTSGTFVVNGNGKIQENGASCEFQPPLFSFR